MNLDDKKTFNPIDFGFKRVEIKGLKKKVVFILNDDKKKQSIEINYSYTNNIKQYIIGILGCPCGLSNCTNPEPLILYNGVIPNNEFAIQLLKNINVT
jgi:hypothetical protein